MSKSFELISNFWSELEKTRKSISHFGGYDGFCQCETGKVIAKTICNQIVPEDAS